MKQIEYINEELCSKCTECCKYNRPYVEAPYHDRQTEDWLKEAFKKYSVYPLRDPISEAGTYCEFNDPSVGCIIPREKRPLTCRIHACDKLLVNYKEANKLDVPDDFRDKRPTKLILTAENKFSYVFEEVEPEEVKTLMEYRLNICKSCKSFYIKDDVFRCKFCGCGLVSKTSIIYPLDQNNKAYSAVLSNGMYAYVCGKKNW